MSSDLLRRAATVLREHAETCDPGPWSSRTYRDTETGERVWQVESPDRPGTTIVAESRTDAFDPDDAARAGASVDLIVTLHPPVADAIARWLDATAEVVEANEASDGFDLDAVDDTYRGAVNTARAILREPGGDRG